MKPIRCLLGVHLWRYRPGADRRDWALARTCARCNKHQVIRFHGGKQKWVTV